MDFWDKKLNADINIVEITDFNDARLDLYARCPEPQLAHIFEPLPGVFLAESAAVIGRALDAGYEPLSFLIERELAAKAEELFGARMCNVPVFVAGLSVLEKLTGYHLTHGMLCAMQRKALPAAESLLGGARRVAVLENIMNPTNVGAIFRSAAALGMDAVLLSAGCCDPLYRRSVRVSMGAVFQVPWTFFSGRAAEGALPVMKTLREAGFWTVSMALRDESRCIDDAKLTEKERLAVLLGTEQEGLREETIAAGDDTVRIPMSHGVDSLNVAAAAAIAFWEMGRANRQEGICTAAGRQREN